MLSQYKTKRPSSKAAVMIAQKSKKAKDTPKIEPVPEIVQPRADGDFIDSSSDSSDDDNYEEILLRDFEKRGTSKDPTGNTDSKIETPFKEPDHVDNKITPKQNPRPKRPRTVIKKYYMNKQPVKLSTDTQPESVSKVVSYIGIGNNVQPSSVLRNRIINF